MVSGHKAEAPHNPWSPSHSRSRSAISLLRFERGVVSAFPVCSRVDSIKLVFK